MLFVAAVGISLFVAAVGISPSWEAFTSVLSAAGGAAATVAVTLVSVDWALRKEEHRQAARERAEWRVRVLEEADQWSREVIAALEEIHECQRSLVRNDLWSSHVDDQDWKERLKQQRSDLNNELATARLSLDDQHEELERRAVARVRWLRQVDEDEAAAALATMLKQLRQWHQDFTWLDAFTEDSAAALVDTLPAFRTYAETIRQRYAEAVPEQYRPTGE